MARKIVLTSGKGGVGKTTVCANLGICLARLNKRIALIDVDIGLNNLDVVMGVENKIVYDLVDVVENKCRVKQALIQDFNYPNLYILPSVHSFNKSSISINSIKQVVENLDNLFDFILIDCPAGIDEPFKRAVSCADEAIVVVTPHISSIRDADKILNDLKLFNISSKSILINRERGDMVINKEMLSSNKISELLNCQLIGIIPEDDNISMLLNIGRTVDENCESYIAFKMLANNVLGNDLKLYDCTLKYRGFWGCLKKVLRKRV